MITDQIRKNAYFRSQQNASESPAAHWEAERKKLVEKRVDRRMECWKGSSPKRDQMLREKFWMEENEFVGWLEWVERHLHPRSYLSIEAIEDSTGLDIHVRQHVDQQGQKAAISDLLFVALVLDGSPEHCRHLWRLHAGDAAVGALIEEKDAKFNRFAQQAVREMGGRTLDNEVRGFDLNALKARRFQDGCVASFGVRSDRAIVDALRCAARLRRDLTYLNQSTALGWQQQFHMAGRHRNVPANTCLGVGLRAAERYRLGVFFGSRSRRGTSGTCQIFGS